MLTANLLVERHVRILAHYPYSYTLRPRPDGQVEAFGTHKGEPWVSRPFEDVLEAVYWMEPRGYPPCFGHKCTKCGAPVDPNTASMYYDCLECVLKAEAAASASA